VGFGAEDFLAAGDMADDGKKEGWERKGKQGGQGEVYEVQSITCGGVERTVHSIGLHCTQTKKEERVCRWVHR